LTEFHEGVLAARRAVIPQNREDVDLAIQKGVFKTTRKRNRTRISFLVLKLTTIINFMFIGPCIIVIVEE